MTTTILPAVGSSNKLTTERTERSREEEPTKLGVHPLRTLIARSNGPELTNRDRSIENILMSLDVRKREVEKKFPPKLVLNNRSIKLPAIFRNKPEETRYNLSEELDQFEDRLSRRAIKPFSQLSR